MNLDDSTFTTSNELNSKEGKLDLEAMRKFLEKFPYTSTAPVFGSLRSFPGFDYRVITSPYVRHVKKVQFRFPRSKRKRMQKKWAKNPINWKEVETNGAYLLHDTLLVKPETYRALAALDPFKWGPVSIGTG